MLAFHCQILLLSLGFFYIIGQHKVCGQNNAFTHNLWPNGRVLYKLFPTLSDEQMTAIKRAFDDISRTTCVRFVEATDSDPNYITIIERENLCYADVGYRAKPGQTFLLDRSCFKQHGTILRLLLFTTGLSNENNRNDRDQYVKINFDNVRPEYRNLLRKLPSNDPVAQLNLPYDYGSLTHYPSNAFAVSETFSFWSR